MRLSLAPFAAIAVFGGLSGLELVVAQTLVPPPFSDTSLYSSDSSTTTSDTITDSTTTTDSGSITSPTDSASFTDSDTNIFSSTTTSTSTDTSITPPPIAPSSPSSSFPSSSTSSTGSGTGLGTSSGSGSGSSSNAGAIAGGVVGGIVALAAIVGIIFLLMHRRRRRQNGGNVEAPPSPRLKSPWLGSIRGSIVGGVSTVTGGATRPARAQRLGSVGGDSSPPSNLGHGGGNGSGSLDADAHELELGSVVSRQAPAGMTGGVAAAGGGTFTRATPSTPRMSRNRSSVSRTSAGEEAFGNSARSSYDLNVFSSNGNAMQRGASSSRQTNASNPFASDPSIDASPYAAGTTTGSGASEISRHASTTRLARKPAPKYEGDAETATATASPTTPTGPYGTVPRGSKPPVSGLARTRTYSNSSSQRARGVGTASGTGNGSNSSRSSFETANAQLTHKSSQGTLGGAFKFAGEKEGVTHYLIPDPPPPGSS